MFFSPRGSLRPLWTSLRVRPFDSHCFSPSLGEGASQNPVWLAVPVALIIASGLCKESGFTLFAIPFLMELLDFLTAQALARHHKERMGRRVIRRLRLRVGLLLASTICVFVARYRHTGGTKLNMSPQDNPISFESEWKARVLSYSFLHGVYMRLLVWPQYLCYDYSMDAIPIVREMTDCRMLLPLAAYVGAIGTLSFVMQLPARHRRAGLIALALLVVSYLPASNILFPVGTVVGERLLYVPSAGYCLVVIVVLHSYLQGAQSRPWVLPRRPEQNGTRHISRAGAPQIPGQQIHSWGVGSGRAEAMRRAFKVVILVCSAFAALTLRSVLRVSDWQDSETLFIRDGERQPHSSKTQFNLGITFMQLQEWDAAVTALVRCAWADPLSSLPFFRIGQIEILRQRFESAERWLSAAIEKFGASLMVRDEEVFHDLALAMFQNGKIDQAETRLQIALQLNPDFAKGWNNLGCCLASRMNLHDGARAVRKAVSLNPDNPQYWANLAVLSQHLGDHTTSQSAMSNALQLWPSMPEHRDCAWEFAPAS
ncbi:TMTC4 [Symbiodinium sp. KB8]|nr:TMTC4 [Symbiodinium sp. KB8]